MLFRGSIMNDETLLCWLLMMMRWPVLEYGCCSWLALFFIHICVKETVHILSFFEKIMVLCGGSMGRSTSDSSWTLFFRLWEQHWWMNYFDDANNNMCTEPNHWMISYKMINEHKRVFLYVIMHHLTTITEDFHRHKCAFYRYLHQQQQQ